MDNAHYHVMQRDEDGKESAVACRSQEGATWECARLRAANPERVYWPESATGCCNRTE